MNENYDDEVQVVTLPTEAQVKADVQDRKTFIGGSDAPVILGLVGWKTRYELYQEKIGEKEPDDLSEVERVQWGIILEDVVAQMYMRRTGKKVRRVNNRIVDKHANFPRAAQIDRRIVGGGILEIKTTDAMQAGEWGEEGTADVPAHYYAQIQHQLACCPMEPYAEAAVLIGGNRMRLYVIPRDQEFIDNLTTAEFRFWENCTHRNPPEPLTEKEAGMMWREAPDREVIGTLDDARVASELAEVKKQLKDLEDREEALTVKLKEAIKDIGDRLVVNGTPVASWKNQSRTTFDSKGLEKAEPETYQRYLGKSESRVFRLLKGAENFKTA